jgi:hypothetical protein
MTYTMAISDNYVTPEGPFADNTAYLAFVLNKAAESYAKQHGKATVEEGVTAAREAYNQQLPPVRTSE